MNTLQLTNEQVDALQRLVEAGLPYAKAAHEQSCIAEVAHYTKHHTDFDDLAAVVENYKLLIGTLEETASLVMGD